MVYTKAVVNLTRIHMMTERDGNGKWSDVMCKQVITVMDYEFNSQGVTIASRRTEELMVSLYTRYTFYDITAHVDAKCYT